MPVGVPRRELESVGGSRIFVPISRLFEGEGGYHRYVIREGCLDRVEVTQGQPLHDDIIDRPLEPAGARAGAGQDRPVVAEGVETEAQMKILKDLGCTLVQGYYFSRPLHPSEFEANILQNL